jgi:hypothetical protein
MKSTMQRLEDELARHRRTTAFTNGCTGACLVAIVLVALYAWVTI